MAKCKECGATIGFLVTAANQGHCDECFLPWYQAQHGILDLHQSPQDSDASKRSEDAERAAIEAILLTTETASDLRIVERLEIVTAECAFGMNIFKDLFAGVRDIVGGRSKAVQQTMRDARRTALFELKREAWLIGANAVVGVDLDYVDLSNAGSMVMLVASGTAVRIAPDQ